MNKILIIEDEFDTALPVKEALSLMNVEAEIAKDGETGLKMFKESNYDLVLLDLKMPGMDGETVLSEIRNLDPFIDVVIYTNYTEFADIKKLTNIGIDGYINKGPEADLNELISCIMRKLAPMNEDDIAKLINVTPNKLFDE